MNTQVSVQTQFLVPGRIGKDNSGAAIVNVDRRLRIDKVHQASDLEEMRRQSGLFVQRFCEITRLHSTTIKVPHVLERYRETEGDTKTREIDNMFAFLSHQSWSHRKAHG